MTLPGRLDWGITHSASREERRRQDEEEERIREEEEERRREEERARRREEEERERQALDAAQVPFTIRASPFISFRHFQ